MRYAAGGSPGLRLCPPKLTAGKRRWSAGKEGGMRYAAGGSTVLRLCPPKLTAGKRRWSAGHRAVFRAPLRGAGGGFLSDFRI